MEINSNKKLNVLELESLRSELIDKTLNTSSNDLRLSLYQKYFEKILSLNNSNFEEAYLKEFLDDYIDCIKKYDVWGNEPGVTKKLFELKNNISSRAFAKEQNATLDIEVKRIELQWIKQTSILNGDDLEDKEIHKAFFPLIDNESPADFYGTVESVTVRISKAVDIDKFILVPSEKEIEKRILEQCRNSWLLALDISKKYVKKPYKFHEVIIGFDKKEGFYEGNSLGTALTISFLEEILKFYNPTYLIKLIEKSAFTGGVAEGGEILNTSENIIKRKVALIFFSKINSFVIPKSEETYAVFTLTQLKKNYPNRKLKVIPAEDINDVLNRRDLVDLRKQKVVVRTGKFVKKNWISALVAIILTFILSFLFVMDFDDNPEILTTDGSTLFVKNKNGKVLWTKHYLNLSKDEDILPRLCRIIDVNSDGMNEILFANEQIGNNNEMNTACYLRCYDKDQILLWKYKFNEKVSSNREELDPIYSMYMIDTLTIENRKALYLIADNGNSFSSAVFAIDLVNGKICSGILWCSGHTYDGIIKDIDGDGVREVFCLGLDNGFEDVVLFGIEIDTLNKVRPSTTDYLIKDYPKSNLITYIRIPKTDYDNYLQNRFFAIGQGSFKYLENEKKYYFILLSGNSISHTGIWYKLDENLKDFDITVDNQFRVIRDSLVAQGKLMLPYSDTEEYKNIIKNNMLYWKNGKWVKRNKLD